MINELKGEWLPSAEDTELIDTCWQLMREDARVIVHRKDAVLLMDLPGVQVKRHGSRLSFYRLGSKWWR